MKSKTFFTAVRRLIWIALAFVLVLTLPLSAYATETEDPYQEIVTGHDGASFTYGLYLTNQNGASVTNPRKLSAGDTLYVEIRLTRDQYNEPQYDSYGIEFRLLTRGLTYNNDGATLRNATQVHRATYMDGDSVGFAWYDMTREGEPFANPVLAASWSYTVEDPKAVNITVPVALIFVKGNDDEFVPVGTSRLFLDVNGGELIGKDVSGEYLSGKAVVLPDAQFGDYIFEGWSDGVRLYPAGTEYIVSGVVTLTAQWADLIRDRYITFVLNGGKLDGEDLSGYYADDEIIILPDIIRDGYRLVGWSDGVNIYEPGDKYVVYNTVNLTAIWELIPTEPAEPTEPIEPGEGGEGCIICGRENFLIPGISLCWICLLIILLGILLILLLFKRRFVKYSLVNGDIALNFKNGKQPVHVEVVLYHDDKEYLLSKSRKVRAKCRLKFIKNVTEMEIADIKPGKYKGKLIITGEGIYEVKKCRIKVLDKELKKKK